MKNYMNWWTGVVEDRNDPQEMGRVRVRIFGIHTDDTSKIKLSDLPWAHIMMPVTSASISGVGMSPTGLVEGSWVVGFFADGENAQDPIVMGSLHGYPTQTNDAKQAFKDYEGRYPRWFDDSDVSKVARDKKYRQHVSYFQRYGEWVKGVERATKPRLSTTDIKAPATEETRTKWSELEPRGGVPGSYPNVHVYESENGIVREIDDTDQNARIVEYHPAGTFYEILPSGTKTTKISGDNYQIVIANDHIYIKGNQTITVDGNLRHLVKGDYILEVMGDYNIKVHGNRYQKIHANEFQEILGNYNFNIAKESITRIGKKQTQIVDGEKTESIGGKSTLSVAGAMSTIGLSTMSVHSDNNQSFSTNNQQSFLSKNGLNFGSQENWALKCNADLTIQVAGSFNIVAGPTFKVNADKIELN